MKNYCTRNTLLTLLLLFGLGVGSALGQGATGREPPRVNEAAAERAERASRSRSRTASISDQVELAIKQGNLAESHGEHTKAEKWYRQALSLNPNEARAYLGLGETYWFEGRSSDAKRAYEEAIRLKPDFIDAWWALDDAYDLVCYTYNYEETIESLKQTLRVDPKDYLATYGLGKIYFHQKRYDEALEQFQRVVQLKPNWAGYYEMGRIYDAQQKYEEAIEAYKKSLSFSSALNAYEPFVIAINNAQFGLGVAYYNQQRYEDASKAFENYVRLQPKIYTAHAYLGNAYLKLHRYNEARDQYLQTIRLKPDSAVAHFGLGLAALELKDKSTAMEQYQELKKLGSHYAEELLSKIRCLEDQRCSGDEEPDV